MKKISMFVIFSYLLGFVQLHASGRDGGNGGRGIFCYDLKEKKVKSAVLRDFVDINNLDLEINLNTDESEEDILLKVMAQINQVTPTLAKILNYELHLIREKDITIIGQYLLDKVKDFSSHGVKFTCNTDEFLSEAQVATYIDEKPMLFIDNTIFSEFKTISKAGLFFHEAIYAIKRKILTLDKSITNQVWSERANEPMRVTALAFANRNAKQNTEFAELLIRYETLLTESTLSLANVELIQKYKTAKSYEEAEKIRSDLSTIPYYYQRLENFDAIELGIPNTIMSYLENQNSSYCQNKVEEKMIKDKRKLGKIFVISGIIVGSAFTAGYALFGSASIYFMTGLFSAKAGIVANSALTYSKYDFNYHVFNQAHYCVKNPDIDCSKFRNLKKLARKFNQKAEIKLNLREVAELVYNERYGPKYCNLLQENHISMNDIVKVIKEK